jgi:hypothetical protein
VIAGTHYGVHAVVAFAHAVQYDDGSIVGGGEPVFEPAITITTIEDDRTTDTGILLTSEAARRLADVLVTAADEVDGWVSRWPPPTTCPTGPRWPSLTDWLPSMTN